MPIERAARALVQSESGFDDWDCLGFELQEEVRDNVCAAFAAIRDATPAMLTAGEKRLRNRPGHAVTQDDVLQTWRAMVDALLAARPSPTRH